MAGEPTGIAYNPLDGHYFFTSRDVGFVGEVDPGPDGHLGTADDLVRSFETAPLGSPDPESITFDTRLGHLFLADRTGARVVEILPGANGLFDGAPPAGDDTTRSFDTASLGIAAPEAIEYDAENDTLFVFGESGGVEATRDGLLVRHLALDSLGASSLAGVAHAPSSRDPDVPHLYLEDRAIGAQARGRIYEVTLAEEPGFVSAQLGSGADDAEEDASGRVDRSSTQLDIVEAGGPQTVGLRFPSVEVPASATILEAHVQFSSAASSSPVSRLTIRGHASGDSTPFRARPGDLSDRERTTASASWSPPAWRAQSMGHEQRTPDLQAVVQEIVDQPSWASGSAITLLLSGTGRRIAHAFEADPARSARLYVRFVPSACGDSVKQPGELCDGDDLGSIRCESLGCQGGAVHCTSACTLDAADCVGCVTCGNGILEPGEECDDGNTQTEACLYGEPACYTCDARCRLVSGATSLCGDGFADPAHGEDCDPASPDAPLDCLSGVACVERDLRRWRHRHRER
jgi:hypothetical protein